jgi:hypothetical protein
MIRNAHQREIDAPAELIGHALDGLGRPGDLLWPSPQWLPMELDRPVSVGASGGHGPVRYEVVEHEPGRRVRFEMRPTVGLHGYHELMVEPLGERRCSVRHEVVGHASGSMRFVWPLAVRPLHDAVVEDLLDNGERIGTGGVASPAHWSWWVRCLRRLSEFPKPCPVAVPAKATLARAAFDRIDLEDAWRVRVIPGMPTDPAAWTEAIFHNSPRWVDGLLQLRDALVPLVGISPSDASAFDMLDRTEHELLLGSDERHLDFRGSVLVDDGWVTLSTVVRLKNWRGRLYMLAVWPIHGILVRSMLHRAQYVLSTDRVTGLARCSTASSSARRDQAPPPAS